MLGNSGNFQLLLIWYIFESLSNNIASTIYSDSGIANQFERIIASAVWFEINDEIENIDLEDAVEMEVANSEYDCENDLKIQNNENQFWLGYENGISSSDEYDEPLETMAKKLRSDGSAVCARAWGSLSFI